MPMVMAALHPTGEVGLVGSAELPQPDSIAANATHTGIRINIRNLPFLDDHPTESPTQCRSVNGSHRLSAKVRFWPW
jgi:hypothetical protein